MTVEKPSGRPADQEFIAAVQSRVGSSWWTRFCMVSKFRAPVPLC